MTRRADGTSGGPKTQDGGVFLLRGDSDLLKEEAAAELIDKYLDPATRDFNLDTLQGTSLDLERFASIVATPPMMAEWRVVVVTQAEALAASSRTRELILGLARTPPPGLALILLASPPARTKAKFWKDLPKAASTIAFDAVSVDDAPGWLTRRAVSHHDTEIASDAARALVQAVGPDLGILSAELGKLVAVADGAAVTLETVRAAGTVIPRQDRWEWFDLVGSRRFQEALRALPTLFDHGESGVGLASAMGTHLLRIGLLLEEGEAGLRAVLPPNQAWLASRLARQTRGWTLQALRSAIGDLVRVDRLLKSGGSDHELLEEWFLLRMADVR